MKINAAYCDISLRTPIYNAAGGLTMAHLRNVRRVVRIAQDEGQRPSTVIADIYKIKTARARRWMRLADPEPPF